ncbi:MAG: Crp/Fnr family transcriptional regulator [bacterium]|nr:Crp/Fnr family transcriptional regulator [bacterium]
MEPAQIYKFLQQTQLRQLLSIPAMEALSRRIKFKTYPAETLLFSEGDAFHGFYLVAEGTVKLVRYRNDGREMLIHFAQKNDTFAEAAIFLKRYPVTGITDSKCQLLLVPPKVIQDTLENEPRFWHYLFHSMAHWLERLVQKIDTLIQNDATSRLVRFLLEEQKIENGKTVVKLNYKKGDLAVLLNMNQATLSRTFRKLQNEQLISIQRRLIILHDVNQLKTLLLPPLE